MTPVATHVGFDLEDSHARLRHGSVEIVLGSPVPELPPDELTAHLRKRRTVVEFEAASITDDRGHRVVLTGPRQALGDGTWTITLFAAGTSHRVDARLLVQGARPVTLLLGAEALPSRLPTPRAVEAAPVGTAHRLAARALRALPPEQARRIRRTARRLMKRTTTRS